MQHRYNRHNLHTALGAYVRQYGTNGALYNLDIAALKTKDSNLHNFFIDCYKLLSSTSVQRGSEIVNAQRAYDENHLIKEMG